MRGWKSALKLWTKSFKISVFSFEVYLNSFLGYIKSQSRMYYSPPMISSLNGIISKSTTVFRTVKNVAIIVPNPSVSNIRKKRMLHNQGTGIVDTASVKATNANPGPWAAWVLNLILVKKMNSIHKSNENLANKKLIKKD